MLGGGRTDIVRFVFVLTYPCVGTGKLNLGRLINLEGKIEPVEIFTNIGIVYCPTCALAGATIRRGAGAPAPPKEDLFVLSGLNSTFILE